MRAPLLVASLALGASCTHEGLDDLADLEFETDSKADDGVVRPFGTFTRVINNPQREEGYVNLTLSEDRTYSMTFSYVCPAEYAPERCQQDIDVGRYRFASSHGASYFVPYVDDRRQYAFEYEYSGDVLRLRETSPGYDDYWFEMSPDPE